MLRIFVIAALCVLACMPFAASGVAATHRFMSWTKPSARLRAGLTALGFWVLAVLVPCLVWFGFTARLGS